MNQEKNIKLSLPCRFSFDTYNYRQCISDQDIPDRTEDFKCKDPLSEKHHKNKTTGINQEHTTKKVQKNGRKKQRVSYKVDNIDEQPYFSLEKADKTKYYRIQKQGRNIGSNVMRTFFRYFSVGKMNNAFEAIKQKLSLNISKEQFMKWLEAMGISHRSYVQISSFAELLHPMSGQSRLFLSLLHNHLSTDGRLHLLTSSKLKAKQISNMKIRSILEQILGIVHHRYPEPLLKVEQN